MTLMLRQPLPLLDNDVLRTFVAIAETGSFTTAADRVYRTPSAVSMQIKKLEEQLNVTLFLRDARSVTLTESGEVLLPYARRMLSAAQEAKDALRRVELVVAALAADRVGEARPFAAVIVAVLEDMLGDLPHIL